MTARVALDAHTSLYESLKHPPDTLIRIFDDLLTKGAELAAREKSAGYTDLDEVDAAILRAWDYYFWPAKTGRDLVTLISGPLFSAPTYRVTDEIVRAVTGMYQATASNAPVLRAADLPSPTGFVYLDGDVTLTDLYGKRISTRALSWGPQLFAPPGREPVNGVRVTCWSGPGGPGSVHEFHRSGLAWNYSVFVPYGVPSWCEPDDITRWLHCLWLFMDTEIAEATGEQADRHSRRRAARARLVTDVTVIMLRRRHSAGDGGSRDIDWSCRWVVQGHDRHLGDYRSDGYAAHHAKPPGPGQPCGVCGLRTTHVRAYVKGPDGMPLKTTAMVFQVSR